MARVKRQRSSTLSEADASLEALAGRVLIAAPTERERQALAASLALPEASWIGAASAVEASAFIDGCGLAMVHESLDDAKGLVLVRRITKDYPGIATLVISDRPSLEAAVDAMRAGATDFLPPTMASHEMILRCREALRRARVIRAGFDEAHDLRRACQRLADSQRDIAHQTRSMCDDLSTACKDLATQARINGAIGEFAATIRPELEVEGLLRTGLEFILAKTGPTNAGIFLPSTSRDFSLGAYVNYDCPADSGDLILEQFAQTLAPRMEDKADLLHLRTDDQLDAFLGDEAHWIAGSNMVAIACRHEEECLAVLVLFRDRYTPFLDQTLEILKPIAEIFAKQLGKVIHVHNRHLPKENWGGLQGDSDSDDLDLAA